MKIGIFTQDILGERDWLNKQFKNFKNLETLHAGQWKEQKNTIYEICNYEPLLPVYNVDQTLKSLYQLTEYNTMLYDQSWIFSDCLRVHPRINLIPNHSKFNKNLVVLSTSRSGRQLSEKILNNKYEKKLPHFVVDTNQNLLESLRLICPVTDFNIIYIYRENWLEWFLSVIIAHRIQEKQQLRGFPHGQKIDYTSIYPITVTKIEMFDVIKRFTALFNFWCNARLMLNGANFYITSYEKILEHHSEYEIPNIYNTPNDSYNKDKSKLFANYNEIQNFFSENIDFLNKIRHRTLSHLQAMKVELLSHYSNL